jgi:exodeoxyribonuclease-3
MKILSWNVNGIRAVEKKGFIEYVKNSGYDLIGLQETKAEPSQLSEELLNIDGYKSYFMSAQKKGYSGVAIYTKVEPLEISDMGFSEFDSEGRVIIAKFPEFTFINAYFPNSQDAGKRIDYKVDFCETMLKLCNERVARGENIVLCGDYNIAHTEIDLARPKQNEGNPGYLPEERSFMTKFLEAGYVDTFRHFRPTEVKYSWWSYRMMARSKNIGWRIDYHCVNKDFIDRVVDVEILNEVEGSDHCPVYIEVK